jgi:CRP-like cAMP-binding protein
MRQAAKHALVEAPRQPTRQKATPESRLTDLLASRCLSVTTCKPGTMLIRQGETTKSMYFVREGKVLLSRLSYSGNETIIGFAGAGDFFGEVPLVDSGVAPFSATTAKRTVLIEIRQVDFACLMQDPAFAQVILQLVVRRCTDAWNQIEVLGCGPLQDRLVPALSWLCRRIGKKTPEGIELQVSQTQLARMIGVARESLNRQLRTLRKASVLSVKSSAGRSCMIIRTPDALSC